MSMNMWAILFLLLFWSGIPKEASGFMEAGEGNLLGVFSGKWEQRGANDPNLVVDSRQITLNVDALVGRKLSGTIRLSNTPRCNDPIPFRGMISEKDARSITLVSDASIVCGYSGKLEVHLTTNGERIFTGSYSYRYLGGVWMEGTFTVSPQK